MYFDFYLDTIWVFTMYKNYMHNYNLKMYKFHNDEIQNNAFTSLQHFSLQINIILPVPASSHRTLSKRHLSVHLHDTEALCRRVSSG